jgi:hypothetical protein
VSLSVQENLRSDVREIINWFQIIQRRNLIALMPSYFFPESLSFCSGLEKSTLGPVTRILKGFFIKMSVKLKYYYITKYMNILPKLYMIYIVLYSEQFMVSLITIPWNAILHTLARFMLT